MEDRYARVIASESSTTDAGLDPGCFNPQLVVIHIGANDYLGGLTPPTDTQFIHGYSRLLQLVRSKRPSARIMCLVFAPDAITGEDDAGAREEAGKRLRTNTFEAVRRFSLVDPARPEVASGSSRDSPTGELTRGSDNGLPGEGGELALEPPVSETPAALLLLQSVSCDGRRAVQCTGGYTGGCSPGAEAGAEAVSLGGLSPGVDAGFMEPATHDRGVDFALISHWSVVGHGKVAATLADHVQSRMGWGYDGGLFPGPGRCMGHDADGVEPTCCWQGCCASKGRCHCVVS